MERLSRSWIADALAILVAVLAADYLFAHYQDMHHAMREAPASYGI